MTPGSICAACGQPGHRFGRNEGIDRFNPQACINGLLARLEDRQLPGFTECPECDNGLEYPTPSFNESHPLPVPCPACEGTGQQPDPVLVEAIVTDRISRNEGFPPDTLYNLRSDARAALIVYARAAKGTE